MSLLKSILNTLFKTAVEKLNEEIERPRESERSTERPSARTVETPAQAKSEPKAIVNPEAYFAEILATEFPQYSVKRNVPVTDLAGFVADEAQLYKTRPVQSYKAEWGTPYSFVLYQGDVPVGIVMLGAGNSHAKKVKYLVSRMFAKKLGLPYINFYTQMPNEKAYVVERIKKFMNV